MTKFREFLEAIKLLGFKHILFVIGTFLCLGAINWTLGEQGYYAIVGLIVLGLIVQMKDFWTKALEVGGKSFKRVWVWIVAVTTFLLLSWAIGKVFGSSTADNPTGFVAITLLSIVLAMNYATLENKWKYNSLVIFLCVSFLAGNLIWKDFFTPEFKASIKSWEESTQEGFASVAEKDAKIRKSRNELPIELVVEYTGFPEDLRDNEDTKDYPQSKREIIAGETILYYPVLILEEDTYAKRLQLKFGEPYGKIRVSEKESGTFMYKWWSFRIIDKNLKAQEKKNIIAGDEVTKATLPIPIIPTIPHDPWIKLIDGTLTVDLLSGQSVKKDFDLSPDDTTPWFLIPANYYVIRFDDDENPDHWYYYQKGDIKHKIIPKQVVHFPETTGDIKGRFIAGPNGAKIVVSIFKK